MSIGVTFKGAYTFAGKDELDAALAEIRELVAGEDPGFQQLFGLGGDLAIDGLVVGVDIDGSMPGDFAMTYELIVETLAERAASGTVEHTAEGTDEVVTFPAGDVP